MRRRIHVSHEEDTCVAFLINSLSLSSLTLSLSPPSPHPPVSLSFLAAAVLTWKKGLRFR
jgi:hypothetical protein